MSYGQVCCDLFHWQKKKEGKKLRLDVLDLLQIKSFAKPKDFGTFCETFAKDPVIYNITLKFASS